MLVCTILLMIVELQYSYVLCHNLQ